MINLRGKVILVGDGNHEVIFKVLPMTEIAIKRPAPVPKREKNPCRISGWQMGSRCVSPIVKRSFQQEQWEGGNLKCSRT